MSNDKTSDNLEQLFARLRAPFPSAQIRWRIGARTRDKKRGQALPYIDARDVQDRLDDVVGPQNWQGKFEQLPQGVLCRLSIRCGGEWVSKEDVASFDDPAESRAGNPDDLNQKRDLALKGAHSDAFKCAAVMWGIGRYLYRFDAPWVPLTDDGRRFASPPALPDHMLPENERCGNRGTGRGTSPQTGRPSTQQTERSATSAASHPQVPAQALQHSRTAAQQRAPQTQPRSVTEAHESSQPTAPTANSSATHQERLTVAGGEGSAPTATPALIGTEAQWNALSANDQGAATILLERIRRGFALHSVEEYLSTGRGKDLPEWLRQALREKLTERQQTVQEPAAAA